MMVRALVVIAAALLISVQIVRTAAVTALAPLKPDAAARYWKGHPAVEISGGLAAIGRAAREGQAADPSVFARIADAGAKSPLSPEPFLVKGVQAQTAGQPAFAEHMFLAAQRRDPRNLSAAYFLANAYFQTNRPLQGLAETGVLARLAPNGTNAVAPYVAAYARDRSNWGEIRRLFKQEDALEDAVLSALAQQGSNAGIIMALASPDHRRPDSPWLAVLLQNLVAQRDYAAAHAIWAQVGSPHAQQGLLYDAGFSAPTAPPPFNWALTTSSVGLAERQPGGKLHVLFYGNEDGVLARQLLLLPAGNYHLTMNIVGAPAHPETLSWNLRCDGSTEPVSSIGVAELAKAGWTFSVPQNCGAQWLELSGRSGDVSQQADVTMTGLSLSRSGGNA